MSPGSMRPSAATGTTLHDGADVDSSIALLVTLSDYTNAQKIILLYSEVERETRWEMNG